MTDGKGVAGKEIVPGFWADGFIAAPGPPASPPRTVLSHVSVILVSRSALLHADCGFANPLHFLFTEHLLIALTARTRSLIALAIFLRWKTGMQNGEKMMFYEPTRER